MQVLEKNVLTESSLYHGLLAKPSLVDNDRIRNVILTDYARNTKTFDQHIGWVYDYVRDYFKLEHERTLIQTDTKPLIQHSGAVVEKQRFDDEDYTVLYSVDMTDVDVILHYDNHRSKENTWTIPVTKRKFIIWNSDIDFEITENKKSDFNIALLINCKAI